MGTDGRPLLHWNYAGGLAKGFTFMLRGLL